MPYQRYAWLLLAFHTGHQDLSPTGRRPEQLGGTWTQEEIGRELGVSQRTVSTHIGHAERALAELHEVLR